jgi:hypothetical protein
MLQVSPVAWGLVVGISLVALGLVTVLPSGVPGRRHQRRSQRVAPSIG